MNKDIIEGKWQQIKGDVQKQWGKLTDDDVDKVGGDANKLAGLIQERYGKTREEVEEEIESWQKQYAA